VASTVRLTLAAEAVCVPDRVASSLDVCSLVRPFLVSHHWLLAIFTCAFGIAYAEARAAEGIGIGRFAGRAVHQYEHEYVCGILRTSGGKCSSQMTALWHSPRSEDVQQLYREESRRLTVS
jgi:hypothetical protein